MAEHTQTPWELFDHNGVVAIVNPRAKSSKREIVFWSGFDASHYPRQAAANAAFIVKAVNSLGPSLDAIEELCRKRGLSPTADSIGLLIAEWVNGEQHS